MPSPGALTEPPIVLLTLEYAGRTWRRSSRPVDISDGSEWHHYRGGLAASDVFLEAPFLETASAPSLPFDVMIDADLGELLAQHHALEEIRAEVALYRAGDLLAQRLVTVSGRAEPESGGKQGRPLRLTVVGDMPAATPGIWPPPEQVVSDDTWTTAANPLRSHEQDVSGQVYPQVLGQPGYVRMLAGPTSVPAVPVVPVVLDDLGGTDGLIRYSPWGDVAGWAPWGPPAGQFGIVSAGMMYPGPAGGTQGQILVTKDDGSVPPVWHTAYLYYATDALGQVVTLCRLQLPLPAWGDLVSGGSYYAAITPPCSGIARRDYQGGLTGAGEIVRWALEQSRIVVDWRRTGSALPALDRYRIGAYWDQSTDAWSWVCDNILPLVPATWIPGPSGLYPVVWRLDATADTADLELTDGIDCVIEGDPKIGGLSEVRSRHILDYAHSAMTSDYRQRVTYHGSPPRSGAREAITLPLRRAQQRLGSQRGAQAQALDEVATTDAVYGDSTAWRILAWRARVRSGPTSTYHLVAPPRSPLASAEPGMVVAITSSRHTLTRMVGHVVRAGWIGGTCYADLVVLAEV